MLGLGAEVTLYQTPGWRAVLGWRAALPLLPASGEADITPLARLSARSPARPGAELTATVGLAILGDPLRPASQDDVPLSWLSAAWPLQPEAPWVLRGRLGGGWPSARSPARMNAALGLGWQGGRGLSAGAEGAAGLTPAAADLTVGLWAGWQAPDP